MRYWDTVPAGKWSVTDITDALDALSDQESVYYVAKAQNRIHVFGPDRKSLLILLEKIYNSSSKEDIENFKQELLKRFDIDLF